MQRKAEKKTVVFLTGISILLAVVVFIGTGSMAEAQMYSQPVKVADYFYEMTFEDYREDTKLETLQLYNYSGCSIVRNGDFIGRNFDFWFNENPVFLVRDRVERCPERIAGEVVGVFFNITGNLGVRHLAASVVGEDVVVPRDGAGKIVVHVGESGDGCAIVNQIAERIATAALAFGCTVMVLTFFH